MPRHGSFIYGMRLVESLQDLQLLAGHWFLGSPYTKFIDGLDAAYLLAKDAGDALRAADIRYFGPIEAAHDICERSGIDPLDHDFWTTFCAQFYSSAHGLIVLGMEGWQDSRGLTGERKAFAAAHKPIVFLDPNVLLAECGS